MMWLKKIEGIKPPSSVSSAAWTAGGVIPTVSVVCPMYFQATGCVHPVAIIIAAQSKAYYLQGATVEIC